MVDNRVSVVMANASYVSIMYGLSSVVKVQNEQS